MTFANQASIILASPTFGSANDGVNDATDASTPASDDVSASHDGTIDAVEQKDASVDANPATIEPEAEASDMVDSVAAVENTAAEVDEHERASGDASAELVGETIIVPAAVTETPAADASADVPASSEAMLNSVHQMQPGLSNVDAGSVSGNDPAGIVMSDPAIVFMVRGECVVCPSTLNNPLDLIV